MDDVLFAPKTSEIGRLSIHAIIIYSKKIITLLKKAKHVNECLFIQTQLSCIYSEYNLI